MAGPRATHHHITTNEMQARIRRGDDHHLHAVPFEVASWDTVPWSRWSDRDRREELPFLTDFLARRRLDRREERLFEEEIRDLLYFVSGKDEQVLVDLRELLAQPWFRRTWVIQEVCLSESPYIMTGKPAVPWIDFTSWCDTIATNMAMTLDRNVEAGTNPSDLTDRPHIDGLRIAGELSHYARKTKSGVSRHGLLPTVVRTRYAQVSNALDKVYGILGLCESKVKSDYSKDFRVLCHEVAAEIILWAIEHEPHRNDSFLLLCCINHEPRNSLTPWAVDW